MCHFIKRLLYALHALFGKDGGIRIPGQCISALVKEFAICLKTNSNSCLYGCDDAIFRSESECTHNAPGGTSNRMHCPCSCSTSQAAYSNSKDDCIICDSITLHQIENSAVKFRGVCTFIPLWQAN